MATKKRRQTIAKFTREQEVKQRRTLKRERKEEAAAAARIAKASGYTAAAPLDEEPPA
jgi:hypothetical protein